MKSNHNIRKVEYSPSLHQNRSNYSEVYYNTESHQHIPQFQHHCSTVAHYPHSLRLKRSCHNTKCRYCFPDPCNNVLTQFDLESKSSSSESASQIMSRNSISSYHNYKKFLDQNSRPTGTIHEEIEYDENRVIDDEGWRTGEQNQKIMMIPSYKEVRVNTPVGQYITSSSVNGTNLSNTMRSNYHHQQQTQDDEDVY
ncbi:unnamed protein product, partial [Trichobilharzia regenti]